MSDKECLEELQKIYTDVSEWLKYAEAKHAGLFAVWIAVLGVLVSWNGFSGIEISLKVSLIIVVCVGIMIEVFAFWPFLNRINFVKKWCYKKYSNFGGNVVFYQSIFVDTYSENNISESIDKYKVILQSKNMEVNNELMGDYVRQIIEVSTVGTIKIYLFNIATTYIFLRC